MSRRKRRLSLPAAAPQAAPTRQGRPVPPPRLALHPDVGGGIPGGVPLTPDEVRRLYGPPRTLGASEKVRLALDSQLAEGGVYTLLQHTFQLGQAAAPQFMGYGALQNMAQNGLLRACIETVADDMTREWITLRGGATAPADAADASDRRGELEAALAHYELQSVFHEAAELVGYEGGAFVFIDTGASGEQLVTPLHLGTASAEFAPGRPLRFTVIDPVNVFPGDYNSISPLRADYFRPRWWWVLGERVHRSRLIRLVANEVPVLLRPAYNFMGIPQAQILWDYVLHFQECRTAEARLLKKFSMTVFKTTMQDIILSAKGTANLDRRVRYMVQTMSNDGVLAVDKDTEDVIKLETPLSGVTDIVRQALEFLAALNRTPAVKLLGISPSGFNATGESDIRNYYDHITSQQEKVLRPGIRRALECVQLHEFRAIDSGLDFDFAPLGEEDRAALATQQKTRADTVAVYLDRGVISAEEARAALAKDPDSPFADIDPEELPEGADEAGEVPPGMEGEPGDVDDVDKAGAVYDEALDASEWRTTAKGKHFELETETGEITKGNIGQEVSITGEELGAWKDVKELRKKAVDYYKVNLQGKPAHRDDVGEIRFSKKGLDETISHSADSDKLLFLPALRNIIETGELGKEEKCKHPRKDGIVAFVPVIKKVKFKEESREVEVLLGKDRNGNLYYELFLDGKREKKSPASGLEPNPRLTGDVSPASYPEQIQGSPGKNPPTSGVGTNLRLAGDAAAKTAGEINMRILPAPVKNGQGESPGDSGKPSGGARHA